MKFLLAAASLLCGLGLLASPLANGNFSEGVKGWMNTSKKVAVDPAVKAPGDLPAVKLNGPDDEIRQVLKLEPDTVYELSFLIKGENIDKSKGWQRGARIMLQGGKVWERIAEKNGSCLTGTFDWKRISGIIDTGKFKTSTIRLNAVLDAKGTCWYADFKLKKIRKSSEPAAAPAKTPEKASAPAASPASDSGLIKNGNFSQGLQGWLRNKKTTDIDPAVKAGNLPAVRLTEQDQLRQTVTLDPEGVYELSFLIKGENIANMNPSSRGARVMLHGGKNWARVTGNESGKCLVGTFDWKRVTYRFATSDFTTNKVRFLAVIDTTGTCWYADFKLKKVGVKKKLTPAQQNAEWFRETFIPGIPLPTMYPVDAAHGILYPGEKAKFQLNAEGENLTREIIVKDVDGNVIYKEAPVKYVPDQLITIPAQKRGYYIVDATIYSGAKKAARVQGGFAVVAPMEKRDPFFQVNHFGIDPDFFEGYQRIGIGSYSLPLVLTNDPISYYISYRFTGPNARFKKFLDSGAPISLGFCPSYPKAKADPELLKKGYPLQEKAALQKLETLVTEVAKALKGRVASYDVIMELPSHVQIANRYCGTWTEAMSQLYFAGRIVSRAVRAVDPKAKIGIGGCNQQPFMNPYERILMNDLINDFDTYLLDAYSGNWDLRSGHPSMPEKNLRSFYMEGSALVKSLGKDPRVHNTETGFSIFYGSRYDTGLAPLQAALTARTLIISKSAPVSAVEVFHLGIYYGNYEKGTDRCMTTVWKPVRAKGKLNHCPLPGSAAYATAARELAFVDFKKEIISTDKVVYSYLFTRPDGKSLVTAWQIEGKGKLSLTLQKPALLISMTGSEKQIPAGKVELALSRDPFYLITEEAIDSLAEKVSEEINSTRPAFKTAAKMIAPDKVRVFFSNMTKEKAVFQCGGKSVAVDPNAIASADCSWKPGTVLTVTDPKGKKINVPVEDAVLRVPRLSKKPVFNGSGAWLPAKLGTLKYPDNIKPEAALQPERNYFRSPDNPNGHNVSADYYLAYDDENLYLGVLVDDPIHQQRRTDSTIWKDDCLQLSITNQIAPPAGVRLLNTPESVYNRKHNYCAALTAKGSELFRYDPSPDQRANFPVKVTRKNNKTFYELALPWEKIGCDITKPVYFSFVVFDANRRTEEDPPYWLELTRGVAGGHDTSKLPLIIFER